jgi:hypothetical protein
MEQYMSDLTKKQLFPRTGAAETSCISLRLAAIVASLFLTMMPFLLTGCGGGGETGGAVAPSADTGVTASVAWSPVPDPSINSYFVHYGRQSPDQPGSCAYEHSMHVHAGSTSATITDLDPNTVYYFAVSAYNGMESGCSNEVSTVTPPASV